MGVNALVALLLATPTVAGTLEPFRSRDALPAREVERAPVLVMGWTTTSATVGTAGGELALSHGLWRRVDGWLDVGWRATDGAQWERSSFGAGALLLSAPSTWLRWEVGHRTSLRPVTGLADALATGVATPVSFTGVVVRQRSGGLRVDLEIEAGVAHPGSWGVGPPVDACGDAWATARGWLAPGFVGRGRVDALLQAGPLLGGGGLTGEATTARRALTDAPDPDATCDAPWRAGPVTPATQDWVVDAGGGIQLSRGLSLWVGYGLPLGPSPAGSVSGTVEVAF